MTRGAVLVEQLDAITRDGLVLAPETVAAIGQAEARRSRWMAVALWADRGAAGLDGLAAAALIALIAMQSMARMRPMASLTVRQLDEKLKKQLRLRAAKNGRSVEDEVRTILRSAAADADAFVAGARATTRKAERRAETDTPTHPAHHRRRHRRLQIARPDPPAARARHRRARGDDGGGAEVHHAAVGRRARRRASLYRPVRRPFRVRRRPYPACSRAEHHRCRARHRRPDGEDGERPRRRSRLGGAARDRQEDPARAGDEPERCGATRRRGETWRSSSPTASRSSARTPARWPRAARPASAGWRSRWRSSRPPRRCSRAVRGALAGVRVLVTSGPTHEPIDPVRYIANRSSGKQGHAIAEAAAAGRRRGHARFPGR